MDRHCANVTGIVLIDDSVGSMIHSTCSLSPMRSHTGDGTGSGVLKTPLTAEQHVACRGSQSGSQETGSLCNRERVVTQMRAVERG